MFARHFLFTKQTKTATAEARIVQLLSVSLCELMKEKLLLAFSLRLPACSILFIALELSVLSLASVRDNENTLTRRAFVKFNALSN